MGKIKNKCEQYENNDEMGVFTCLAEILHIHIADKPSLKRKSHEKNNYHISNTALYDFCVCPGTGKGTQTAGNAETKE